MANAKAKPKQPSLQKFDAKMRSGDAVADLAWYSPEKPPFYLAGFPWFSKDGVYRRMPLKPKDKLPEAVDWLANHTAGGQIRFQSNSRKLSVRVKLLRAADMVHMPATGQCGFDCYVGPPRQQRFMGVTRYDVKASEYQIALFDLAQAKERNITLNFPLYQGVQEISVGLEPGASLSAPPPYALKRPVVIYGTSITQGGCASRPGMAYTNILSRRLNVEIFNLGFSGSGKGEPEVARTIATIRNPALIALDYESNCGGRDALSATLPGFIQILRRSHPQVPILVISKIRYAAENFNPSMIQGRLSTRDYQRDTVATLRRSDPHIFFADGGELLGSGFDECAVDGVHPTDLGFLRMADGLEPVFRTILGL